MDLGRQGRYGLILANSMAADERRLSRDSGVVEDFLETQVHGEMLVDARSQLDGADTVPTQGKEVVIDPDRRLAKQPLPDFD